MTERLLIKCNNGFNSELRHWRLPACICVSFAKLGESFRVRPSFFFVEIIWRMISFSGIPNF